MTNQIATVRKGESFPFAFSLENDTNETNSINGYTCTISVKKYDSDTSVITPRQITPTGNTWEGYLTSTETAGITDIGTYRLIALINNATTDEEEQQTVRFNLTEAWA